MMTSSRRPIVLALAGAAGLAAPASAQAIDFSAFSVGQGGGLYPPADTFFPADWQLRDAAAGVACVGNANVSIFYRALDVDGMRISGQVFPGDDEDLVGFAFGYTSADDFSPSADYLIMDWKGADQSWDFLDVPGSEGTFHDVTGATFCRAGLRLCRVRGTPTGDEFWGGVDLPENDTGPFTPGGVTELARAMDIDRFGYDRTLGTAYQFDIDLTAANIKVWVNGELQFDLDAPPGAPFETTGFGLLEQYQDSPNDPDQGYWTGYTMVPSPGTDPTGPGLDFPEVNRRFSAAFIENLTEHYPPGTPANPDEQWWAVAATTADNPTQIVTPANRGDVAFNADGQGLFPFASVAIVTMAENRTGPDLITAEAVPGGQFGVEGAMGVALAPSPADPHASGNEANADFALVVFPFADGWLAGSVLPSGVIADNPAGAVCLNRQTPDADDQAGLYDLTVPGADSATAMLFVCGASNEDNVAAAISLGDGWRVGVRDNGDDRYGGPQTFENDDFNFVVVDADGSGLPAGARVVGFDGDTNPLTDISCGGYTLVRAGVGAYRLTVAGQTPATGVLMLTANASVTLDDPDGILDEDAAPLDHYPSYRPDGDDFIIQIVALDEVNAPADGPYSSAFVPPGAGAGPCNPADFAEPYGTLDFFDVQAFHTLFSAHDPAGDITHDAAFDFFDVQAYLNHFAAGCP
jgi:hypothetical protein